MGRVINVARLRERAALHSPCRSCGDQYAIGVGQVTNPVATQRLMEYWAHGKGALKIRWGTDGAMKRCIRKLRKYFPERPGGLCANLHKRATGEWPRGGIIPS
jgi:hypothetical protein